MKKPGQIVLLPFPQTDQIKRKLRPALLLKRVPGPFDDWLLCMISSQVHQTVAVFDEVIKKYDADFKTTGLKTESVVRIGRLAVVNAEAMIGSIGSVAPERLEKICSKLAEWIKGR